MTPAVSDVETLLKLNQPLRHCCFIAWASSYSRLRQELLEHVLQENIPERGYYIIYVFNLLYSMGYFPPCAICIVQECENKRKRKL